MNDCRGSNIIYPETQVGWGATPGRRVITCPDCGRTVNCRRYDSANFVTNRHKPTVKARP